MTVHDVITITCLIVGVLLWTAAFWNDLIKRRPSLHQIEKALEIVLIIYSLFIGFGEGNWTKAQYFLVMTGVVELDDYTRRKK